ncbi:uncharacterized protein DS421_3g63040 [Arachis hypogaea]|nr:uncharacterized protein DS421_3g63040 [Arachis hypogaea]
MLFITYFFLVISWKFYFGSFLVMRCYQITEFKVFLFLILVLLPSNFDFGSLPAIVNFVIVPLIVC